MTTYRLIKIGMMCMPVLLILSTTSLFAVTPIWAPEPLERIIEQGLSNNQEIKSLEALIKSLEAESVFASALSDPKVGISFLNMPADSFRFDREPMTQKQFFISQKFPWFGKLDLKTKQVVLKAKRLKALLQAKRLGISRNFAEQYYDLGFIQYSLLINAQLREMVKQALEAAKARYATGQGLQQDIFQGQVEISKLQNEEIRLLKRKQVAESRILALMNQRDSALLKQIEDTIVFPDLHFDVKKLHKLASQNNPLLEAKEAEIDAAKIGVDLARKDFYPDFDVKLSYGQRDEDRNGNDRPDFVSASVAMNIPLWKKSRQEKKVISQLAEKNSIEKAYQNLYASLPHQINELLAEIENNQKSYTLYAGKMISQTEEWALSALAAYEVGKIEFDTMIKARLRVLRFQLQAKKYLFGIYKKRAALEEVLGVHIPILKTDQERKKHEGF